MQYKYIHTHPHMYEPGRSGSFLIDRPVPLPLGYGYLNLPQETPIPSTYEFVGLTPSVHVFLKNTIFVIFNHTHNRKRCDQVGTSPCYSQNRVRHACLVLGL